jgi:hypothetical protein
MSLALYFMLQALNYGGILQQFSRLFDVEGRMLGQKLFGFCKQHALRPELDG